MLAQCYHVKDNPEAWGSIRHWQKLKMDNILAPSNWKHLKLNILWGQLKIFLDLSMLLSHEHKTYLYTLNTHMYTQEYFFHAYSIWTHATLCPNHLKAFVSSALCHFHNLFSSQNHIFLQPTAVKLEQVESKCVNLSAANTLIIWLYDLCNHLKILTPPHFQISTMHFNCACNDLQYSKSIYSTFCNLTCM